MTDLAPIFNAALKQHDSKPINPLAYRFETIDEFLKEAYRINKHIAELTKYLRSIRQSYLSTVPSSRRKGHALSSTSSAGPSGEAPSLFRHVSKDAQHLTDEDRSRIDAETKQFLRTLNSALEQLSSAEDIRQQTAANVALKKRARTGLGALGRWAAGSGAVAKSSEEQAEEEARNAVNSCRDSVLWYLRKKLQDAGQMQANMMEIRLNREVEKNKSVLYKAPGGSRLVDMIESNGITGSGAGTASGFRGAEGVKVDKMDRTQTEERIPPEQLQLLEQENQNMLKHYQGTLDQVRTAERSLLEIAELQTQITSNLALQTEHIQQLVQDSFSTSENVGSGNKQLKRAAERPSPARVFFYSTCAFCAFLVTWDLIF